MPHQITVDSGPLGQNALLFRSMTGAEGLSHLFEYRVEVLSEKEQIAFSNLVGESLAVHLEVLNAAPRHFHGLVTQFQQVGNYEKWAVYSILLKPSLWLLNKRTSCRIFQRQSVPDIIKAVLGDYGQSYENKLSGSYPPRDFTVQYRETDFDFISRLMEHEGIYYYFTHEASKHKLVLADSAQGHQKVPGYEAIPFYPPQQGERREQDHIDSWQALERIASSTSVQRDYDFTKPQANLETKRLVSQPGKVPVLELYDYPGDYHEASEGERYAKTRLEESVARREQVDGGGNARGLAVGSLFGLVLHPRADQNREYLVVKADYQLSVGAYGSGGSAPEGSGFHCSFSALPSRTPYRPPRLTSKPLMPGPQTARVVGKEGEEIWTDQYGRVKVKFHWDRADRGEDSSCWIRVAQAWAGSRWGAMHLPRIGQEVVVEFLGGNPDRPLITGQLYDQDHMPPYPLPANQTRSGFKSRSTKGGTIDNANEIRFEDKKGEEQFYVQAERNYDALVKNDETREVGHDETRVVKHDRHTTIDNDETVEVKGNRTETVTKDESITISGNRTESVTKDESITISGNRTETVTKNESVTISGSRTVQVTKDETADFGANKTETVAKDLTLTVQGNVTESVSKNMQVSVSGDRQTSVSKSDALTVSKSLTVSAGDQIVLTSGSAEIVLKKNGDITIRGKNITLDGSGAITVNASRDVVIKGSKIGSN